MDLFISIEKLVYLANRYYQFFTYVACDENIMVYYFNTGYYKENVLISEIDLQMIFTDYQVSSGPLFIEISDGHLYDTVKASIKIFLMQLN